MDSASTMESQTECEGFDELGLVPAVLTTVRTLGYETPTPVQCQCIPHLLQGRDLLGQAQTGTGKTAAFALPLIGLVELDAGPRPQVLVLTPTRELALQVAEAFQTYARGLRGFHVLPLYGGSSFGLQARALERGVHAIVGTPGRVMDHLRRGTLDLMGLRSLVLDEADEMLDMGFAEDIEWILERTPAERQMALFSATMPSAIRRVAHAHLRNPVEVRLVAATETVDTIDQYHCLVTRFHKLDVLTRVLEVEDFDAMLVFVRTKLQTLEVAEKLAAHGFNAEALNGDMTQSERERTVERLKRGRLDILVATDVAARGLDLERLSLVVNYDIPTDPASYVHRIGRTGRAGREGRALLFVEPRERHLLKAIERTIRRSIPELAVPTAADLSAHRIERFTAMVTRTLAEADLDFFYRVVARIAREGELDAMDIAAALTYQAQRERPLQLEADLEQAPKPRFKRRGDRPQPPERGEAPGRERRPESVPPREPARRSEPGPGQFSGRRERPANPESSDRPAPQRHQDFSSEYPRHPERLERPERAEPFERGERSRLPDRHDSYSRPDERPALGSGERVELRRETGRGADRGPGRRERDQAGLICYRIEVGHRDGVAPREIVGAIANEAGLEGRFIGRINIEEDHSLVDLPEGMPREIFQHLRGVFVRGKRLNISLAGGDRESDRGTGRRPFRSRDVKPEGQDPGTDRRPGPPRSPKPRRPTAS